MQTNFRYSIVITIFWLICFSIELSGIIVLLSDFDTSTHLLAIIFFIALFLLTVFMLWISIKNIQWFNIRDGYITVYNPFGTIKREHLSEIKKVFTLNAEVWGLKMLVIRRSHLVICVSKSITTNCVNDAYNRKKNAYIIIPRTEKAKNLICYEYKKIKGEELIIK